MSTRWWSEQLVDDLLREDVPHGDLTTDALGIGAHPARITLAMRGDARVCGTELALALLRRAGADGTVHAPSGAKVAAGDVIVAAEGPAGAVHQAWKVAQTLVEYLSGVATATAAIVAAARAVDPDAAVVTTRKTLPGSKALMIAAIRAGGALPHRLGLSETVLVFPEHRVFLDDPAAAIAALRAKVPEKKIIVEVASLEEAEAVLPGRPDVLQCEKMSPDVLRVVAERVARAAPQVTVAAAGGVNAGNAAAYVAAGARVLVTSAPYWAAPADVKVTISRA